MRKLITVSMITGLILLMAGCLAPAQSQDPANEEKPTFYHLVPGTFVNGWPRFTVTYPKDWVEQLTRPYEAFHAGAPGYASFGVTVTPYPPPLDKFADLCLTFYRAIATDVTIVSDKPSQLRDGTPAREVEVHFVLSRVPFNTLYLATKKEDVLIHVSVGSRTGKIGEDLKAILYSLEFEPGKDEPVKVPPDVQEFFDELSNDIVSHDVAKVMSHYSDRFLLSGLRKGEKERLWRQLIGSWMSLKMGATTDFVLEGDRAYIAGFGMTNFGKVPLTEISIIKENGEWKFYGNQRDPSP
jgi:hypothetical protein